MRSEKTPLMMGCFYFASGFNRELKIGSYSKVHAEENMWTIFGFDSLRR